MKHFVCKPIKRRDCIGRKAIEMRDEFPELQVPPGRIIKIKWLKAKGEEHCIFFKCRRTF